jgi:hypothetical protein
VIHVVEKRGQLPVDADVAKQAYLGISTHAVEQGVHCPEIFMGAGEAPRGLLSSNELHRNRTSVYGVGYRAGFLKYSFLKTCIPWRMVMHRALRNALCITILRGIRAAKMAGQAAGTCQWVCTILGKR